MALTITEQNNTVFLEGTLNASTVKSFKTHLGFIQKPLNNLTVNLDRLSLIDESAMQTLKIMYKNAIENHTMFFVEGNRSEEVYESFHFLNIA